MKLSIGHLLALVVCITALTFVHFVFSLHGLRSADIRIRQQLREISIRNFMHPDKNVLLPNKHYGHSEDRVLHPCLVSDSSCIEMMKNEQNVTPILVSFQKDVAMDIYSGNGAVYKVPNIVHYISFGEMQPFKFYTYISYKSVDKFIKPHCIFVWADKLPQQNNTWWMKTREEVANIYYIPTQPVYQIKGKNVTYIAHASDYLRLQIIRDYGGIYIDNDVIVLKSFDKMRVKSFALGRASPYALSNGIMVGEPNGMLIALWLESYENYQPLEWGNNSVVMANRLSRIFPHLIHIEEKSFNYPTWRNISWLYVYRYNLTDNYSIHLYWKYRYFIPRNEKELDGYNCTLGDAMRMVLYGTDRLRSNRTSFGSQKIGVEWEKETFNK